MLCCPRLAFGVAGEGRDIRKSRDTPVFICGMEMLQILKRF